MVMHEQPKQRRAIISKRGKLTQSRYTRINTTTNLGLEHKGVGEDQHDARYKQRHQQHCVDAGITAYGNNLLLDCLRNKQKQSVVQDRTAF